MSEDPLTPESLTSVSVQTEPSSRESPHSRVTVSRGRIAVAGAAAVAAGAAEVEAAAAPAAGAPGFERRRRPVGGRPRAPGEGVLYVPPKENAPGVLVSSKANYLPSPKDPLVPRELIQREGLEAGALIVGMAADGGRPVVKRIETVEGMEPGRVPPAPRVQRADLDRPQLSPEARDRARRDVRPRRGSARARSAAASAA